MKLEQRHFYALKLAQGQLPRKQVVTRATLEELSVILLSQQARIAELESIHRADLAAATRLRRVCTLLGLSDAVPQDDAELMGVLFSVLGKVARRIEDLAMRAGLK